jgi:hypothetical protein
VAFASTVSAVDVTRRYGEGETAVQALRGVSLSGLIVRELAHVSSAEVRSAIDAFER